MASNDWETLGENIRDIVQNAIDSQNFKALNQSINSTIHLAAKEMEKGINSFSESINKTNTYYQNNVIKEPRLFASVTKTRILAIVLMSVGYSFFGVFLMTFLGMFLGSLFFIPLSFLMIIFALIAIGFFFMGYKGSKIYGTKRRFQKYIRGLNGKTYTSIENLSYKVGRPKSFVVDDLETMIRNGWFIEGHLDNEKTTLMITDEVYNDYLTTMKKSQEDVNNGITPQVREILETGNAFIFKIHQCNDEIPGEEISQKISRMELLVERIFKRIEKHPENIPDIKKLMKYYLPTTIKLLEAYKELDNQLIQGENIVNSKKEIEKTLDTLNVAFEKLLDDMFMETAWDVSSDISVLETLLAQEGLTENKMKGN